MPITDYPIEIIECDQGTPEWHAARAGLVTASCLSDVLAKGRGSAESKTRKTYMRKLIAERLSGRVVQTWAGNAHTERGHEQEPEARELYAFLRDVEPKQVGFIRRGPVGCSPDSLVGDDGLLEIKTKLGHLQIEVLESGVLPSDHYAQVQGQLWISGRGWCDFLSYSPGLPPFLIRQHADLTYHAELERAVSEFLTELDELAERVRNIKEAA